MKENLRTTLQKKADQCRKDAEFICQQTNDWQSINEYLSNRSNELELTKTQQEKLERYQYIYNQLGNCKYSVQQVAHQLTKLYKLKIAQAYHDIKCSKEIFNTVINLNKLFELNMQLENNRLMLRKAEELCDLRAYAQLEKNRVNLIKQIPVEDDNLSENFEGHIIEAVFDPSLLGAPPVDMKELLTAINAKRNKKINIDMFEEIPFVDTPNE